MNYCTKVQPHSFTGTDVTAFYKLKPGKQEKKPALCKFTSNVVNTAAECCQTTHSTVIPVHIKNTELNFNAETSTFL